MKRNIILGLLLSLSIGLLGNSLQAKTYQIGNLVITNPWARASAGMMKKGAAYIPKLMNNGQTQDRLIAVSSAIAKKVELHLSSVENGIAIMRHVDGLNLKPGKSAVLRPGGYHIMMMGLHAPLKIGQSFPITLTFEKAGKIEVVFTVRKSGSSYGSKMDHGKMKHGKIKP